MSTARRAALAIADSPPSRAVVRRISGWDRRRRDGLAILTYHRIDEPGPDLDPRLISASPEAFARQVAWLADAWHPVSLAEVLARRDGGPALPRRAVLVSFDDAYRCFADIAWPILRASGVPAALFVPTAYPGDRSRTFWWDRLYRAVISVPPGTGTVSSVLGWLELGGPERRNRTLKRLRATVKSMPHAAAMAAVDEVIVGLDRYHTGSSPDRTNASPVLSWDTLRSLAGEGVAIDSHTRTHPLLDRLSEGDLDVEIAGARADLDRELGGEHVTIAYPNGNHSPQVLAAVGRSGARLGFTTRRGTNDLRSPSWLALRRINVSPAAGEAALTAQLHGWIDRWT